MGIDVSDHLEAHPVSARVPLLAEPTRDPNWVIVDEGFTLTREHEVESLFSVGNGHSGTRGSLAEGSPMSTPATVVAGVYDAQPGTVASLVTIPDWTHLSITIDGHTLRMDRGHSLEHRRILDFRQGLHWREWRYQDADGRITRIRFCRLASLADRNLLVQCVWITPENYDGQIVADAHLIGLATQIVNNRTKVAVAVADRIVGPDAEEIGASELMDGRRGFQVTAGQTYRIDRVAALYTSRETDRPDEKARRHSSEALRNLENVVERHCQAWLTKWREADLQIKGDRFAQQAMRFAFYHLMSSANPQDEFVSIGARGLTGHGYRGHVFWDTEIYMLPFFLLCEPAAARALVMYRYHTLPAARAKAARNGYQGALYPWESVDGEEATPPYAIAPDGEVVRILTGEQEQHISADVGYAVWNYWWSTGDDSFLLSAGLEILIETARFWASRVAREEDGLYHIRGVIGPDEYHVAVDDNAYTNGMAQWNLETAAELTALVAEQWPESWQALRYRLGFEDEERERWTQIARDMYTGFDEKTGLFEQFRGYFKLEDIDLTPYESRAAPMDILLGRERIAQSQVLKQPDVLMLIYLLWDRFPEDVRRVNFEYYEPRCDHGSSLSPAIHALLAARLGKMQLAEQYFRQSAEIDLANNMGNAAAGVHVGALGGLWQAVVFGFAGLNLSQNDPTYDPKLPASWQRLSMRFHHRGRWHDVTLSNSGDPINTAVSAS
ncbi:MAG: glycoside hydrolase family 65 [Pseudomonadota bacterium]|jgi:kojibiose phosphorylase|nr:MAG: glycoside hydrolase family 65 [Pseudomonadota bacterium]